VRKDGFNVQPFGLIYGAGVHATSLESNTIRMCLVCTPCGSCDTRGGNLGEEVTNVRRERAALFRLLLVPSDINGRGK